MQTIKNTNLMSESLICSFFSNVNETHNCIRTQYSDF
uniref:Uncharacterized protein n=1 Tax=Arundo donax TaxID=35708 RepID=A0A0A8YT84_ARUDO